MEIIPIKDLQNLANIIANEGNISLKNQLSAWVTAKAGNPDHVSLSSLSALAHHSSVKEQILVWVSNITTPKPEFVYVPDTPMEMVEHPEINTLSPEEIFTPEYLEEITKPDEPTEEIIQEVKPKKTRKKKED